LNPDAWQAKLRIR